MGFVSRGVALLSTLLVGCGGSDVTVTKQDSEIVVSPTFADLGVVAVGTEVEQLVTVQSTKGDIALLAVDLVNVEGEAFSLPETPPAQVSEGTPVELRVLYAPTEPGYQWARLTLQTDAVDRVAVEMRAGGASRPQRSIPRSWISAGWRRAARVRRTSSSTTRAAFP